MELTSEQVHSSFDLVLLVKKLKKLFEENNLYWSASYLKKNFKMYENISKKNNFYLLLQYN